MTSSLPPCRVAVVSMGRSGTSLVSRILHELLEVDFGDAAEHIGADAANPDGYFENRDIMAFNQTMLAALGYGIAQLPPLDFDALANATERGAWHAEVNALLTRYAAHRPRFGFKDPRLSLNLPVWRDVMPDLKCVIMIRHPVAVARSASAQLGVHADQVLPLWREYYRRIFHYTRQTPRVLVSFEDLLARPALALRRIGELCEVPEASVVARIADLAKIVRPGQSKHSEIVEAPLDASTAALWELISASARDGVPPNETALANALGKSPAG